MNIFKKYKMQPLLIYTISFMILLLLIMQGIVLHFSITRLVSDKIYDNSAEVLEQMNLRIYEKLNQVRQISLSIAMNNDVKRILEDENTQDPYEQILNNRFLNNHMANIINSIPHIKQIVILSDSANKYSSFGMNGLVLKESIKDKDFLSYLDDKNEGFIHTKQNFLQYDSADKYVITFFRKLVSDNKKEIGTLCIFLGEEGLREIINDYNIESSDKITFIINDKNKVISPFTDKDAHISQYVLQSTLSSSESPNSDKNMEVVTVNGQRYLTIITSPNPYGWRVVQLLPYNNIGRDITTILYTIIYLGIIFFFIAVLFLLYFSRSITSPIQNLITQMEAVGSGSFDICMDTQYTNEIGDLYNGFEKMILKIKQLLVEINQQHHKLRLAEFNALQSQINPHFLYNTLDSINWMAINIKAHNISKMVSDLGNLFRLSLNKGNTITFIEKEIEHLRCYMNIQSYRYNNRFTFVEDYDPEILPYCTIKLILQPIVENCLIHGFSSTKGAGEIIIKGFCDDYNIIFIISDNGIGVDSLAMNEYLKSEPTNSDGYGGRNVDTRIKMQFGYEYGLTYLPTNAGTKVQVKFPKTPMNTYI